MEVDLHVHTIYSPCSRFTLDDLVRIVRDRRQELVVITDHGTTRAAGELRRMMPDVSVIAGSEITTSEGDFLVFSMDAEWLERQDRTMTSVRNLSGRDDTVLIWAHPMTSTGSRWGPPRIDDLDVQRALECIDGIETQNGRVVNDDRLGLLSPGYFSAIEKLADEHGLAKIGGSDAHRRNDYGRCVTGFDTPVDSVTDLIAAVRERRTQPFRRPGISDAE